MIQKIRFRLLFRFSLSSASDTEFSSISGCCCCCLHYSHPSATIQSTHHHPVLFPLQIRIIFTMFFIFRSFFYPKNIFLVVLKSSTSWPWPWPPAQNNRYTPRYPSRCDTFSIHFYVVAVATAVIIIRTKIDLQFIK